MAKGNRQKNLKYEGRKCEMQRSTTYLQIVNDRGKRDLPLRRVYRNIRNRELFLEAYGKLYANDGATTVGVNPDDTIQGMSLARIDAIIKSLEEGNYKWKPARREYVLKKNGKKRPISIPSWSDKLVQEVIRRVLEAYYEPHFSDLSHGFRPNRGCHTALQAIKQNWTGTKWFIEADIKGCFDNIDHSLLLEILERNIQDKRLIKLLRGMLKAGYLENWKYHRTYSGTPQGGVISPLLSNIFLNELDRYVEQELIPQYTRGKTRARNPEYERLNRQVQKAKKQKDHRKYRQLVQARRKLPSLHPEDPQYSRLRYIRYADDVILGFTGSKSDAVKIKVQLSDFLEKMGLTLSTEKTLITHARDEKARFLGYDINVRYDDGRITHYRNRSGSKRQGRKLNGGITLTVPKEVVQKWIGDYTRGGKAVIKGQYLEYSDFEIIKTYGSKFTGLANYYALASDRARKLSRVRYLMQRSLGLTIANKHKKLLTWFLRKYTCKEGRTHIRITIERESKPPLVATFGAESLAYAYDVILNDEITPYQVVAHNTELVRRLLAEKCEACGTTGPLQAHHTRRIADLKKRYGKQRRKPAWVEFKLRRRRKTIMLCPECHADITYGRYDQRSLK
jgi:group II intron reverse transcriptase/maturase